ncbi:MAG TPA: hypothetical protein VFC03_02310 [Acidimicrobiales bacterium]|nr:hypothetical protein [Acidimicrobiales bacterium]
MTSETSTGPDVGATADADGADEGGPVEAQAPLVTLRHAHAPEHARSTGLTAALRALPPDLSPFWRRSLVGVAVVQLVLIIATGSVTALSFHLFSPIDEGAHFAYVQQIAEHGSLPVLGKTENSLQVLAISQGVYPGPTTINPKSDGLAGMSYEAFQPPLYYVVAVPAFYASGNFITKVHAIRLFDLLLLLAAVALAGRLCRAVLGDQWMIGWTMTMVFFALPGVVLRFVTISNLALAVPLTLLFVTEVWIAWERHSPRRLIVAGVVLGLCILTELELLLLVPVFALVVAAEVVHQKPQRSWLPLVAAVAVPVILVAPWLLFNEATYHMATAAPIAIKEQTAIINPHHLHYSLGQLPKDTVNAVTNPTLVGEWGGALGNQVALTYLDHLLAVLVVPASLVLILGMGRRLWSVRSAILGLPWLLNVVELWYIRYIQQWSVDVRYTFPTLPILLVLAAVATDTFRSRFLPVLVTLGATASLVLIWAFLIFGYTGRFSLH